MFSLKRVELPRRLASGFAAHVDLQAGGKSPIGTAEPATPHISLSPGKYHLRLAKTTSDRDDACRLRFRVFNIELGEGLASSYNTGLDQDGFDWFAII